MSERCLAGTFKGCTFAQLMVERHLATGDDVTASVASLLSGVPWQLPPKGTHFAFPFSSFHLPHKRHSFPSTTEMREMMAM